MQARVLGQKRFGPEDQISFARLSGDWNPMHMDATLARRTQAGAPVVHGIHNILAGLELAAALLPPLASMKAIFSKVAYVGELVEYRLNRVTGKGATIEAFIDGVSVARLALLFGQAAEAPGAEDPQPAMPAPDAAINLTFQQITDQAGWLGLPAADAISAAFPAASRLWGSERIAALLATSLLVGMVCPGLHSIYGGFTLQAVNLATPSLGYRVTSTDQRFRMLCMQVQGSGVFGTIDSFSRLPPVLQPRLEHLAGLCAVDEFAGSKVLIIGGSRGLGELTAKLLALGGAQVVISFARGEADANAVADSIRGTGGVCSVLQYDFHLPLAQQPQVLQAGITHLYYFATPQIFRRKAALFETGRYAEFQACYITAFHDLFLRLHAAAPAGLTAFYPSSVAVTERPRDMTEYTMAKAAGEILCADITAFLPNARVVVGRLPRLPTDQTSTISLVDTADPVSVMLPLIRQVQATAEPSAKSQGL